MEDTSIQGQLAEIRKLTEENNQILKAMRRDALIAGIIKFIIWVGLIGFSYYVAMQLIGPYMEMFKGMQGQGQSQDFTQLLKQYQELLGQ